MPEGFAIQPKLKSFLLDKRAKVWANGGPFDWAYGEALAMGSLLLEGIPVRLSGQDCAARHVQPAQLAISTIRKRASVIAR